MKHCYTFDPDCYGCNVEFDQLEASVKGECIHQWEQPNRGSNFRTCYLCREAGWEL